MPNPIPNRAHTPEQKRAVVEAILEAWLACPELRLGQMISGATAWSHLGARLFYIEDEMLAESVKTYARRFGRG